VAASAGLKQLGERFGDLTLYTGCIDAGLDAEQRILPGVGDVEARLCGLQGSAFVG
jgi:uracil phosphoribosyltransferase